MSYDYEQTSGAAGFYLMRGGPIYKWMVKLRLHGGDNAYVGRRSLLLISVTWVPLLLLSLAQGVALPGAVKLPFLYDFSIHVNFLVTLPLLIIAEIIIEPAISIGVSEFLERGLIRDKDRQAFDSILAWAERTCNSGWSELVIAVFALIPFVFVRGAHWTERLAGSWALAPSGNSLSLDGFWAIFVSGFFLRAIVYRWVWRLIIWTRLLSRLARLDLNIIPTHPDRAGGLGFVGEVETRFGILSFAVGAVTSANVAANISRTQPSPRRSLSSSPSSQGPRSSFCFLSWPSPRRFTGRGGRVCVNMAHSPPATTSSSTGNGYIARIKKGSPFWAPRTFHHSLIWA